MPALNRTNEVRRWLTAHFPPSSLPGNQGNRSPLVSVCIPVYNCERYIGEAIQSVLDQTLADFELIVCDDCSTDGTLKAVEGCRDPRIRIFRNDANIGMWPNWNKAMSHARGKYIKLLCADDVIYSDCLQAQVDVLKILPTIPFPWCFAAATSSTRMESVS